MLLFTSRFSNPELKTGKYTAVRISVGAPRWNVGYPIAGAIRPLMPTGIFGRPEYAQVEAFRRAYIEMLNRAGTPAIREVLRYFAAAGNPVVLLCFEDIRQSGNWCHRTMFADWWYKRTGEMIKELPDPTPPPKEAYSPPKTVAAAENEQLSIF